eukprot:CAMPEP_0203758560 /NCGR_PEP_ID=MMETSP0098-20131031/11421_1 /ASSEMBLY_ACC=CAM_ASM_000208 /TAXON_ID=96639 /ORGANISM=" , Strain NY0313808BC1" /LENGTH=1267 /DNA_ID=CAMNT_0050651071 /DNA_START=113 /DNA_END=3913 /DNA_ORIENTATION=-
MSLIPLEECFFVENEEGNGSDEMEQLKNGELSNVCVYMMQGDVLVAFVLEHRAVYVARLVAGDQPVGLKRVANLKGVTSLLWGGSGKSTALLASYANGLVRVLSIGCGTTVVAKEFVLYGAGIKTMVRMGGASDRQELVWILYNDKVVLCAPLQDFLSLPSWSEMESLKMWRLKGQVKTDWFTPFRATWCNSLYHNPDSMFVEDVGASGSYVLLTAGNRPSWALYVTERQKSNLNAHSLGGLVSAVASTLGDSMVSFAKSWVSSSKTQKPVEVLEEQDTEADQYTETEKPTNNEKPLRARHAIFDSAGRVMCGGVDGNDPSGRYGVTIDQLGRVSLVDTVALQVVRIWKGYRDAQVGWVSSPERWKGQWENGALSKSESWPEHKDTTRWGNCLVILAPRRQTIQLWRVPGCILIASFRLSNCTANNTFLSTYVNNNGLASCFVTRLSPKLSVSKVQVTFESLERLFIHTNRGKNQQETFVLHQFRRAIADGDMNRAETLFKQTNDMNTLWRLISILDMRNSIPVRTQLEFTEISLETMKIVVSKMDGTTLNNSLQAPSLGMIQGKQRREQAENIVKLISLRKKLILLYQGLAVSDSRDKFGEIDAHDNMVDLDDLIEDVPSFVTDVSNRTTAPISLHHVLQLYGGLIRTESYDESHCKTQPPWKFQQGCSHLTDPEHIGLATFLFLPLTEDIFLYPRVESALTTLGIAKKEQLQLFLSWWFSTNVESLVAMLSNPSTANSRFLETFLEEDLNVTDSWFVEAVVECCSTTENIVHAHLLVYAIDTCLALLLKRSSTGTAALEGEEEGSVKRIEMVSMRQLLFSRLCTKIRDTLFILSTIGPSCSGLTIHALEKGDMPYPKLVAKAQIDGASELELCRLSKTFPVQHKNGTDAIHCHRALLLSDSLAKDGEHGVLCLDPVIRAIYCVKRGETRGGIAMYIWKTFVIQALTNILDAAPMENHVEFCEAAQELLCLIRNALVVKSNRSTDDGDASDCSIDKQHSDEEGDTNGIDEIIVEPWPPTRAQVAPRFARSFEGTDVLMPRIEYENMVLLTMRALILVMVGEKNTGSMGELVKQLFPANAYFFQADSLSRSELEATKPGEMETLESRRLQLVQRLLRVNPKTSAMSFEIALAFHLPLDQIRLEYMHILYSDGLDTQGEEVLAQIEDQESAGLILLAVARSRMASILNGMQASGKYKQLLAVVSADTSRWIRASASTAPNVKAGDTNSNDASLSLTLILLRRLQELLPNTNPARKRAVDMTRAADALW